MGNCLFNLGDESAAAEVYHRVLQFVEPPVAVGATVLVRVASEGPAKFVFGMVSDVMDTGHCDIMYDESLDRQDEEGVNMDRITTLSGIPCIACATRLNIARCCAKAAQYEEVVEQSTILISLIKKGMSDMNKPREERLKLKSLCFKAFHVRGKGHLAQNHVKLATKDARNMANAAVDDAGQKMSARFMDEGEKKSRVIAKANRKLAKDVSLWVDQSMRGTQHNSSH
ncbi:unnamed protein product [Choristocarpus tenellus]